MSKSNKFYIGMDVHKDSIDIAIAESGEQGEVRHFGTIPGDLASLDKTLRKIRSNGITLHLVYEAGPCGYVIYRHLFDQGLDCIVVAPSLIPKRSGDRVKTDRRDALKLARLHRAGELSPIYIPDTEDEAIRDLVRARTDARQAQARARHQLKAFLLRAGIHYQGKTSWTPAHMRWLSEIQMPHPAQHVTFQEYIKAVEEPTLRIIRITEHIHHLVQSWHWRPVVKALQALRGVQMITAVTLIAELGDLSRFDKPRQLMHFLGLTPSEYSSGPKTHRGTITKTGNTHARKALIEAAWHYRWPPRVSRIILLRQQKLHASINTIAWEAQLRLYRRYKTLRARGKCSQKAVVAVARELAAFVWAIARQAQAMK